VSGVTENGGMRPHSLLPDESKVLEPGDSMLRFLAAGWLTRRLARPISRVIPNPYLRAAAIAGAGVLASRLLKVGPRR
jgi:hypothetical protein